MTKRAQDERTLQEYVWNSPRELEEGLIWLGQLRGVKTDKWLRGEDASPYNWIDYHHRSKKIDLVGLSGDNALVLCELKAHQADGAPFQVFQYYLMLEKDKNARCRLFSEAKCQRPELKVGPADFIEKARLYIVVAGYASKLLWKQIDICCASRKVRFGVFEAIPPGSSDACGKSTNMWRFFPKDPPS